MLIVAGPILRRVCKEQVAIWVATTDNTHPMEIWVKDPHNDYKILGESKAKTLQFGKNFFVHFGLVAPIKGFFPLGQILSYDFRMGEIQYKDLAVKEKMVYGSYLTPTFIIQPNDRNLCLLTASCRKLHGPASPSGSKEYDGLQIADDILKETVGDTAKRPHILMLTGDQIYADDVAFELTPVIEATGQVLISRVLEVIPTLPVGAVGGAREDTTEAFKKATGFTTLEGGCHLTRFSDFVAMYCIAWKDDPSFAKNLFKTKGEVFTHLKNSLAVVGTIRRVMANVSTAMIFDDHEITDDWFFDKTWKDTVFNKVAGRTIIANGLAAYAIFQAWGNDPNRIKFEFLKLLSDILKSGPEPDGSYKERITLNKQMLNFKEWSYDTDTFPKIVVPDSRTQRGDSSPNTRGGVALLGPNSILELTERLAAARGRPQVFVMATPPFMPYPFEAAQHLSPIENDDEGFSANPIGWARLLDMFLTIGAQPLVILTGDVHFGFVSRIELKKVSGGTPSKCTIFQVTASAARNSTTLAKELLLNKLFAPDQRQASRPGTGTFTQPMTPSYQGSLNSNASYYSWSAHVSPYVTCDANLGLVELSSSKVSIKLFVRGSGQRTLISSLQT